MPTLLLVDDEPQVLFTLEEALAASGYTLRTARSAEAALPLLGEVDAVVTDLSMPGLGGAGLLEHVRAELPELPVVVVTARGSERLAAQLIKAGAYDYLPKPFALDELRAIVGRAAEAGALRRQSRELSVTRALGRPLAGRSAAWRRLMSEVERVARRPVGVLVTGETGTGKELVASLLHALSPRASGPLVRFNCAAVPAELAEAELFGHARGAFTGAGAAHRGYFARAHGGTLVLDEVGELPPAVQPKLLRALQEGELQPLGTGTVERVDVRVVACTHRALREAATAGTFREDLYYRLAVVTLRVPPLRERPEDVEPLAEAFCRRWAERFDEPDVRLTPALLAALSARPWPGNARELENTVARLVALSDGGELDVTALDAAAPDSAAPALASAAGHGAAVAPAAGPLRPQLEAFERAVLATTLAATGGNQSEAARRLGLSRSTLIEKLHRHGLLA